MEDQIDKSEKKKSDINQSQRSDLDVKNKIWQTVEKLEKKRKESKVEKK